MGDDKCAMKMHLVWRFISFLSPPAGVRVFLTVLYCHGRFLNSETVGNSEMLFN